MFLNLFVNSIFSMACGLLVTGFFIWLFRVETGPWKLFLLSLPFVKIVYDAARGLPPDSVLLSGLDPFSLPPKHQLLQIGAGLSYWGPKFNLIFSVNDSHGKMYAASVGDYLTIWLSRSFEQWIPPMILSLIIGTSVVLLSLRIGTVIRFERRRRRDRETASLLRLQKLKFRTVDIYISNFFSGTPFTGGIFRPYVCIPRDALEKLNHSELEAVIAHELGHIRQFDIAFTAMIQFLGDAFWFLIGYRWLSRRIDSLREIVADGWAVRSGVDPLLLASALLKVKSIPGTPKGCVLYSAFFRERSLLKLRVERLLGKTRDRSSRFGWQNLWLRLLFSVWISSAVMIATLGGNHQAVKLKNPQWFDQLLKDLDLKEAGVHE